MSLVDFAVWDLCLREIVQQLAKRRLSFTFLVLEGNDLALM